MNGGRQGRGVGEMGEDGLLVVRCGGSGDLMHRSVAVVDRTLVYT